ncbi:MAG: hypothetical protein HRT86_06545 [Ilumatobacteraceae bacterium]|nr:hypothetical protein [Ilumatobacteraceae bacterium]
MFGKAKHDSALDVEDILGDEQAAEEMARVDALRDRVEQVESQLASQFTSLAAYAQIAQEQVELVRSEAKANGEQSEHRLTTLIERERNDRIASVTGDVPDSAPDVLRRVESMERTVAKIARGLEDCLDRQLQLAEAISAAFERQPAAAATIADPEPVIELVLSEPTESLSEPTPLPELSLSLPPLPSADAITPTDRPIPALSLD